MGVINCNINNYQLVGTMKQIHIYNYEVLSLQHLICSYYYLDPY
jgi:hypothetical protein